MINGCLAGLTMTCLFLDPLDRVEFRLYSINWNTVLTRKEREGQGLPTCHIASKEMMHGERTEGRKQVLLHYECLI